MFIYPLAILLWIGYGLSYYKRCKHEQSETKNAIHCFICIVMSPVLLVMETIDNLMNYERK